MQNLASLIVGALTLPSFFLVFQLRDYNSKRYLRYFKTRWLTYLGTVVLSVLQIALYCIFKNNLIIFFTNFAILGAYLLLCHNMIEQNKTPLKWTNKLKRLYSLSIAVLIIPLFFKFGVAISSFAIIFLPVVSNFVNIYDKLKNLHYIKLAQKKLKELKPKIIAITGSNGKTSIKNILLSMLGKSALASPKSYNTPLGISMFINNDLSDDYKYLILEYGARKKGDIKKLCKIFGADYGVCSLITTQHIETFKSVENIYLTKKELPDFLDNKFCAFNLDNEYTSKMFNLKQGEKCGISIKKPAEIYAKNIKVQNFKTYFDLHILDKIFKISTSLLGEHNVTNILLATAVAIKLGITIETILNAIENLKFIPHRLEYIRGRINILDDSYNCSISSARESLKVLSCTENKKMVCTPGIIEGGKMEKQINFELGKMCAVADFVVIVGSHNREALKSGLKESGFNFENLICANSLKDAERCFSLLDENDTLLLLNDLPDDYS